MLASTCGARLRSESNIVDVYVGYLRRKVDGPDDSVSSTPCGRRVRVADRRAVSTRRLLPLSIHTRLTLWYAVAMLVILVLISAGSIRCLPGTWPGRRPLAAHGGRRHTRRRARARHVEATERWLREVLDPTTGLPALRPDGDLRVKSSRLHTGLVLSSAARSNVAQGLATFETVDLNGQRCAS